MAKKTFRIGRVRGDLRGKVWYLTYHDQGKRHRPRAGSDLETAKKLAAQINSELESETPTALSFKPVKLSQLRTLWLDHHEHVARSSIATINRYRAATQHFLDFLFQSRVPSSTSTFRAEHAAQFVRYLRTIQVHPNGHPHAPQRPLRDRGIRYILQTCRAMLNFAIRRRHLPPYAENPFATLEVDRMRVEDSKTICLFTADQERRFLEACDAWQVPVFLTLMLTGMRPGELSHLLYPEDLTDDLSELVIRNQPVLGWQVKTRRERTIPIDPALRDILRVHLQGRDEGVLFVKRTSLEDIPRTNSALMLQEIQQRLANEESDTGSISRERRLRICKSVWRDAGMVKTDRIRTEMIQICRRIELSQFSSPKMFRHLFATTLQEANVDPLVRSELMGHSTGQQTLGTTAIYTHTRPETRRVQLERALASRAAVEFAKQYVS